MHVCVRVVWSGANSVAAAHFSFAAKSVLVHKEASLVGIVDNMGPSNNTRYATCDPCADVCTSVMKEFAEAKHDNKCFDWLVRKER